MIYRVHTRGMKLAVHDGHRKIVAVMSSSPVARDVARRFAFWADVEPARGLEWLFDRAVKESEWAVRAQTKRRFRRAFRGAA